MNQAAIEQPMPTPGKDEVLPVALDRIIGWTYAKKIGEDLQARHERGLRTYGTPLMTENGRDCLMDLYQEALDGIMYATQYYMESGAGAIAGEMLDASIHLAHKIAAEMRWRNDSKPLIGE